MYNMLVLLKANAGSGISKIFQPLRFNLFAGRKLIAFIQRGA